MQHVIESHPQSVRGYPRATTSAILRVCCVRVAMARCRTCRRPISIAIRPYPRSALGHGPGLGRAEGPRQEPRGAHEQ
eukprot:14652940-Alexandrium_andersonii.AAC.1